MTHTNEEHRGNNTAALWDSIHRRYLAGFSAETASEGMSGCVAALFVWLNRGLCWMFAPNSSPSGSGQWSGTPSEHYNKCLWSHYWQANKRKEGRTSWNIKYCLTHWISEGGKPKATEQWRKSKMRLQHQSGPLIMFLLLLLEKKQKTSQVILS